ncbi:MAG: hypothetical protein WCL44_04750 [bacterium]
MLDKIIGLKANDKAQALAEFVLVFPVIVLVFLLMLQHLIIVQASLVGNYAAYAACRVYAVQASIDKEEAKEKAIKTAALVYSPVSRLMPGEVGLPSGGLDSCLPAGTQAALESVVPLGTVLSLVEGYVVARYIRLNEDVSGGSIKIETSGNPAEVVVEINYAQPVLIPGLSELWKVTGGGRDIAKDLAPMADGLEGWSLNGLAGLYPSVNVRSKCAMGYEDWGSNKDKYRPRKRKTVESKEATNPELEKNAKAQQAARDDCEAAFNKMQQKAEEFRQAEIEYNAVKAESDAVMADPNATSEQKQDAQEKLDRAGARLEEKREEYNEAREDYEKKKEKLDDLAGTET